MPRFTSSRARGAVATAAGVLLMGAAALAGPAVAVEEDFFLDLTSGTVAVGDSSFTLPSGGGFNGVRDDASGAVTGEFVVPVIQSQVEASPGVVGDVTATFVQIGEAMGTIDPTTGATDMAASFRLELVVALSGTVVTEPGCQVSPIDLALTGAFDEVAGTLTLEADGFDIPPSQGCGGIGSIIDDTLTGDTSVALALTVADGPIETPTTTRPPAEVPPATEPPAPTPPPAAAPAAPVTDDAQFTG